MSGSRAQSALVLAALIFSPTLFAIDSQRIYRDVFIDDVATLAIGLAFVIAAELKARAVRHGLTEPGRVRSRSRSTSRPMVSVVVRGGLPFLLAALVGGLVGVVTVTKPTWQWMVPAVIAPLAFAHIRLLRRPQWRSFVTVSAMLAVLIGVGSGFWIFANTKLMNQKTYGVGLVEDFSTGSFARTWHLWASVEAGPTRKYVQVTKAMRLAVYKVSPAAREMERYLESPNDPWKTIECYVMGICQESGTLFDWDLRTAAFSTKRVHSVRQFQAYFTTVADQISSACSTGTLRCSSSPVLATGLPPLNQIPASTVASDVVVGLWHMAVEQVPIGPTPGDRPTKQEYALWRSVVPDLPSVGTLAKGSSSSATFNLLDFVTGLCAAVNLVLLAVLCFGPVAWLVARVRRRQRHQRADRDAAWSSVLFFLSGLIGVGTLAVFAVAQQPGYVQPVYWADFSTPVELCIVFGALASWPVLKGAVWSRLNGPASF
jgi:hypothetical protein